MNHLVLLWHERESQAERSLKEQQPFTNYMPKMVNDTGSSTMFTISNIQQQQMCIYCNYYKFTRKPWDILVLCVTHPQTQPLSDDIMTQDCKEQIIIQC